MVRQRGDGLADGGEPLGLDHGLVVAGVLDGQGRLVGDGDGQLRWSSVNLRDSCPRLTYCVSVDCVSRKSTPRVSWRPFIGTQIASRMLYLCNTLTVAEPGIGLNVGNERSLPLDGGPTPGACG